MKKGGVSLFISQSGETADTLAALRYCKEQGQKIVSIVNVAESTMARESDCVLRTLAGPEIGVASTKAFTGQVTVLSMLALAEYPGPVYCRRPDGNSFQCNVNLSASNRQRSMLIDPSFSVERVSLTEDFMLAPDDVEGWDEAEEE